MIIGFTCYHQAVSAIQLLAEVIDSLFSICHNNHMRKMQIYFSAAFVLVAFVPAAIWFWVITGNYSTFNNPIEILQGILVASTTLLALTGTFFTTRRGINKKYLIYSIFLNAFYVACVIFGLLSILNSVAALIDYPPPGTNVIPSVELEAIRNSIRYFSAQIWIFIAAFAYEVIGKFIIFQDY